MVSEAELRDARWSENPARGFIETAARYNASSPEEALLRE